MIIFPAPVVIFGHALTHLFLLDLLFHIRFLNVVHLNVVREVLLVLEHAAAGLAGKNFSVPVALFVPLPQLDRIEHDVAKGASVVLPLLGIEMRHSVFGKLQKSATNSIALLKLETALSNRVAHLLCVLEGARANVALALQRVLVVVVDALVLHAAAVGSEDGAALPPTDVRLDAGVRVEMPLHVRLIQVSRGMSSFVMFGICV